MKYISKKEDFKPLNANLDQVSFDKPIRIEMEGSYWKPPASFDSKRTAKYIKDIIVFSRK